MSSVLPGCAEPWNRGVTFSCTATHPESTGPITSSISKLLGGRRPLEAPLGTRDRLRPLARGLGTPTHGLPMEAEAWGAQGQRGSSPLPPQTPDLTLCSPGNTFRPQVHLLPPPSEELALNELVSLTCLVRGFSPKDVLIRWLQGTQELPPEKYVTWESLKEPGQSIPTFAVTSVLRIDAEAWKQGDKFSCMVGHEALPLSFTQKTIDRLAGKPTHVNVSVVMAEVDGVCY